MLKKQLEANPRVARKQLSLFLSSQRRNLMAKTVYVVLASSRYNLEVADPEWTSLRNSDLSGWEVKSILGNSSNNAIFVMDREWGRHDRLPLVRHFGLNKDVPTELFKTRIEPKFETNQRYLALKRDEELIVVYQRNPSDVFTELSELPIPRPAQIEDFFFFVKYEVIREKLPEWGRTLIQHKFAGQTLRNAIQLPNEWYATWASKTVDGGSYLWDADPWTTDYIDLIHKSGKVIHLYQNSYETWDQSGILEIRLSRSGKSIVATPYDSDYERETVIPLSMYLS